MWLNWLTDSIREFIHRGDRLLLTLCLLASGFGMVLIYSATRYMNHSAGLRCMLIQAVGIVLGVFVYIAMSSVDIELFTEKSWKWLFLFGLFINLLLLTPLGIGADETGNNSWLSIPGFPVNLQPAELAKLTFVLLLAWQMNRQRERGLSRPSSVFQLAGHTLVMIGLIVATSGDFGMALTYAFIFVIMAWAGGVKKRWFLLAIVVCVIGAVLIWPHISDKYFARRITVVIDHITGNTETISEQTQGQGFQQTRSILAIGSGGLFGMGYLKGIQTQSLSESALPARHTDEIFAVCGEEFGLIGCIGSDYCPLHLGGAAGLLASKRFHRHGVRRDAVGPGWSQRGNVSLCVPRCGADPAVHQLWRHLHRHHVCGHGHYLQYQNALPSELAAGSEPYLNQWTGAVRFGWPQPYILLDLAKTTDDFQTRR